MTETVLRPFEVQWQALGDTRWYYVGSRSGEAGAKSLACRLLNSYRWIFRTRIVYALDGRMIGLWENPNPTELKPENANSIVRKAPDLAVEYKL